MKETQKYKILPYNPKLRERAKSLRKAGILHEVLLWNQIKSKQLNGLDFDRQKIIGNYIVDFYIKALGLVVEIDGLSHEGKVEYDYSRQLFLESFGIQVFRVGDGEVKNALIDVLERLEQFIIVNYGVFENHP